MHVRFLLPSSLVMQWQNTRIRYWMSDFLRVLSWSVEKVYIANGSEMCLIQYWLYSSGNSKAALQQGRLQATGYIHNLLEHSRSFVLLAALYNRLYELDHLFVIYCTRPKDSISSKMQVTYSSKLPHATKRLGVKTHWRHTLDELVAFKLPPISYPL